MLPLRAGGTEEDQEEEVSDETKHDDGGPAFPSIVGYRTPSDSYAAVESIEGLSVRDHVAVKVLAAIISHEDAARSDARDQEAAQRVRASDVRTAFDYADAYVAERKKRGAR